MFAAPASGSTIYSGQMVLETRSSHFLFPILSNIYQRGWSGIKSCFAPKLSQLSWSDYCEKSEERSTLCVASDYSEANLGNLFVIGNVFEERKMQDIENLNILSVVGFTEKR